LANWGGSACPSTDAGESKMNKAMPAKQRGFSFSGFIIGIIVLVLVGIMGLKLVPAYIQDAKIQSVFITIAHDPDMQKATLHDIKIAFGKRADIDDISAIKADDIEIAKEGETLVLSANYSVVIPLVANISLYLDFNPTSAK
jgi:hypothetical protein